MGTKTVRFKVVLSDGGNNERTYYPLAPKGCDTDAEHAARMEWREEFGDLPKYTVLVEEDE